VRLKLYKGNASVVGRKSPDSLYSERHVTFEDDAGAYDQKDAAGFIKLNALRLKLLANQSKGKLRGCYTLALPFCLPASLS
jgi:argininosuccinate synthase